jgi:hypothetical protein
LKTCFKCKEEKDFSQFSKNKNKVDSYYTYCKECKSKATNLHIKNNREKVNARVRNWYSNNEDAKGKQKANIEKWIVKNPDYYKTYKKENQDRTNSYTAKRRANKKSSIPKWVDKEEEFLIQEAYDLSQLRTKLFGFVWHVDHIIPLQGKKARGLHTINNLQVIPARLNLQKGNRYES